MVATAEIIREKGVGYSWVPPEKLPKTAAAIWRGAFLGLSSGSLRHAVQGDDFHGMATQSYLATDAVAEVIEEFTAVVPVDADTVLANSIADRGFPVYLEDSNTLMGGSASSARKVCGKIVKWISSGIYLVHFKALPRV